MPTPIMQRIVNWAQAQTPVRALILEGSQASAGDSDALSDYDINVFLTDPRPYADDDAWLNSFADVWLCTPATVDHKGAVYASRLVIYKGGTKVDFILYPVDVLKEFAAAPSLPEDYDIGYNVLLDKDGLTQGMPAPSFRAYRSGRPTPAEFQSCVNEFWHEAYHVAKYLSRRDLWLAKFRDWTTKSHLIRVIEWHQRGKHGWDYRTHPLGKHMKSWVDPETWTALHRCFGGFDAEDAWPALFETLALFGRVARETAAMLGCTYPADVERNITSFAEALRSQAAS